MRESFTAGAARALERAEAHARRRGALLVEPLDVLVALAEDPESRAASLLVEHGADPAAVLDAAGLACASAVDRSEPTRDPGPTAPVPPSQDLRNILAEAVEHARAVERGREVGTEHLLVALSATPGAAADLLARSGLRGFELIGRLAERRAVETAPLPVAHEIAPLELAAPGEGADLARILDASANRAREGLRVVEDYARFALNDPMLTRRLKDCRHRLAQATRGLEDDGRLVAARDTPGDVGTHIMTGTESARENPRAVLAANFRRTAEALRTLEEYAKLIDPWLAGRFEVLRYDVYTLEKLALTAVAARGALAEARLCVLVGGLPTLGDLTWVVGEALAGGAQLIQLREKGLPDREVLRRAREVRILTAQARARFVVNDRPDLAALAGADGVHVGQDDLSVRDARRIVGPRALVGVSTHDCEQLERAALDGAGYLGVGPVFASATKDFSVEDLAGLAFVRQAAETTTRPWFAIGGIGEANLDAVLEAGARRIAVGASVVRAERPREAAALLRRRLDEVPLDD
jgi:thiamine-phosphate pyrophosphorylase